VHFVGVYSIIILQYTVQRTLKQINDCPNDTFKCMTLFLPVP